jgi:DNA-binding SARP family transcriptional activator
LAGESETRIQLCGRLVVRLEGRRVEHELPGRQGRLAFVYLVLARQRQVTRDELLDALWPQPPAADALSPLLSKLRRIVPLEGRGDVRLALPQDAWVDVEAAREALHRAESAMAREDWAGAWGPGRVTQHVAARGFLPGEELGWAAEQRRQLEELHVRALELVGRASLALGGTELATAERAARTLLEHAPYRESGYRLLMETHAARGNRTESLLVYDDLRRRLRDELGSAPSPETQALHRRLLD